MADHDNGYKLLFSHAETVADFLQGFVKEDWVRELDFSTLKRVDGTYISDDLRSRESDVVWRVSWRGRPLYVYLLLEFQSTEPGPPPVVHNLAGAGASAIAISRGAVSGDPGPTGDSDHGLG